MYKTLSALSVVLSLVFAGLYKIEVLSPVPTSNTVIAEKPDQVIGGQAAVVVPQNLSNAQYQILNAAYSAGKSDGHKNPELVQLIVLQETRAGGMKSYKVAGNKGDEYYGVSQIKLGAAKDVMQRHPELWAKYQFHTKTDDELKANLILNQAFNIEIASKYLKLLQDVYGYTGRELVNAYNRGPGGVKTVDSSTFHYAKDAELKLLAVKRHQKI